jgi:glycosyltransferase involved in cell wall biosynthesis
VSVLERIQSLNPFDIVEAPLWSGEGVAVGVAGTVPLVVRLETPLEVIRQISQLALSPAMVSAIAAERLELSYAAGVISISQAVAATVEEIYETRLETHARRSTVIPIGLPGADTLLMEPTDPPNRDGTRILYVGRLEARKGILELGHAFAAAARTSPELRLWIAGADNSESDGHRARTGQTYPQTLLDIWGPDLSRRVHFLGRVSDVQKNALLAQCDIFAAPSLYESFGIVFLEAMRLGKPVIGTRVGGIPEIVLHGETGLLVPPHDSGELAQALLSLARDAQGRERMGAAGLRRFLSHFTRDECARRSETFYHQVISDWHGCRFAAQPADRSGSRAA